MTLLCRLIRSFTVLLFAVFWSSSAFAVQDDWSRISYHVVALQQGGQTPDLAFSARAPPTTSVNLTSTGTAFAQTGKVCAFDGQERSAASRALIGNFVAPKGGIDDIIAGGQRLPSTGGRTTQIQKTGGLDRAKADFNSLGLNNVRDIKMPNGGSGRVGELSDGTKVIVRSGSSENRPGFSSQPTLEIQYPNGSTKIRY